MEKILKTYLKRLTNLSGNNKSLILKRLNSEQFADIHSADFLLDKSSFEILIQLIQQKKRIPLCDVLDPRFEKSNLFSKRLRKIARTDQFITEERGTKDLYVGYPFIKGRFADGSPVHAPLLFFPVQLKNDREKWCLFPEKKSEIILNQSFALAYGQFNQVKIPDDVLEKSFEEMSDDPLEFRTQLYEWLKETPFQINFNQNLFQDILIPFGELSQSELINTEKSGELKLYPEAVLGIFPQSGSYLVPDYSEMLRILAAGEQLSLPLFPAEETEDEISDEPLIREEQILTAFPADIAQEQVIRSTKKGSSIVVQGPPGTGKSQLICNLMVDFAARGKKVLLVCQKRAALDVVHQRLNTIGLQDFMALIHDFHNDRASLYRQLNEQIEKVDEYKRLNYSLDAIFLEREFIQNSRLTDKIIEELESFKQALYDESVCGISVKQLYLTSSPDQDHIPLDDLYTAFPLDSSNSFARRLKVYSSYLQILQPNTSWESRKDFSGYSISDFHEISRFLKNWSDWVDSHDDSFRKITGYNFNFSLLQNRKKLINELQVIQSTLPENYVFLKPLILSPNKSLAETQKTVKAAIELLNSGTQFESTLSNEELPGFKEKLLKGIEAKNSFAGMKWLFFPSIDKQRILDVVSSNHLTDTPNGFAILSKAVDAKITLNRFFEQTAILSSAATPKTTTEFTDYFQTYQQSIDTLTLIENCDINWQKIIKTRAEEFSSSREFRSWIEQLSDWLTMWEEPIHKLNRYFTDIQQQLLFKHPKANAQRFEEELNRDFDNLVETDKLWNEMTQAEKETINRLLEVSPEAEEKPLTTLFDNSIRLAWIEHIETLYPQLRSVSSQKMQHWEEQLQQNIVTNRELSKEIALIKLREDTYSNLENNRLGNRLTYRELNHQVTKKRKIWPVRKLFDHFHEEILRLVPCWMASPESVSAIFPMKPELFDLIIFDEASQCYAEYGLPAIFRGKQVVITGDSKQLPPSNLYRVRYEESDDENNIATETDSLLDLSGQYLPAYYLTGHYRSQSLDLIDFSNQYFYNGKLRLLPNFHYVNQQERGIQLIKTEGIWENNTNLVEAEHVIDLVKSLVDTGKSIGIVTFNFFQQRLIQDLLEQETIQSQDLFVKNIENVQGDERDIIIFSLGYAPDSKGRLAMQFGTLNMAGGENRLNVAITRAREKIYIVTSIWPSQLNTDNATHEGPKLLKAYLQYALDVSEGKFKPFLKENNYHTEWLLKKKLTANNQHYESVFPFADLAIRKENQYTGLILTDDDLYHQSVSPKEPHANLPILLRQKHWPFTRFFSRQYWLGKIPEN